MDDILMIVVTRMRLLRRKHVEELAGEIGGMSVLRRETGPQQALHGLQLPEDIDGRVLCHLRCINV